MNEVNKTLYIPLYGRAQVSQKGIIIDDPKAEEIWKRERFPLRGKAKSRWLTYFMAMRARVFDDWTANQLAEDPEAVVLHIGCGLDGRVLRVGRLTGEWYDVDFPEVIAQRRKYYSETKHYHMLGADAAQPKWLEDLPGGRAVVVMEGVSMYLKNDEVAGLLTALEKHFDRVCLLMDIYTTFGAKASKYKNPINEEGVTQLYGIDDPASVAGKRFSFVQEHTMTPKALVEELTGFDRWFFRLMFTGKVARKIYRLFEYRTQ